MFLKERGWNFFLLYILKVTFPCLFLIASNAAITGPVRKKISKESTNLKVFVCCCIMIAPSLAIKSYLLWSNSRNAVQKETCIVALGGTMSSSFRTEDWWTLVINFIRLYLKSCNVSCWMINSIK